MGFPHPRLLAEGIQGLLRHFDALASPDVPICVGEEEDEGRDHHEPARDGKVVQGIPKRQARAQRQH